MTIHLGAVPASSTLYIPFATYGRTNGESITLTGLAVTDIEIYKNGSTTQRASDAGFTLLDTDGIDFDAITGIHGFSIDLADNTDAGFYAVGSFYWVVVSSVTIDGQVVNFIAATFRIVAAEATAGYPAVDAAKWNNLTTVALPLIPTTAGRTLDVSATGEADANMVQILGSAVDTTSSQLGVRLNNIMGSAVDSTASQLGVRVNNAAGTAWNSGAINSTTFAADAINSTVIATDAIGSAEIASAGIIKITDGWLDRDMSLGTDSGSTTVRTPRQAMRFLRNKWDIAAGTLTVKKEDDATTSWTAAVSSDAAASPIIGSDPAG